MINFILLFNKYKKQILFVLISMVLFLSIKFYINKVYEDGYNDGKKYSEDLITNIYNEKLKSKINEFNIKNKEKDKIISDFYNQKEKENIIFKDKIKIVEKVIKEENMLCELTEEQIILLNKNLKEIK